MAFSRVKTVVHPDYARFEDFVRRLPQENFPIDRVFCDRRNTVVATHDQGMAMVVKKYARPTEKYRGEGRPTWQWSSRSMRVQLYSIASFIRSFARPKPKGLTGMRCVWLAAELKRLLPSVTCMCTGEESSTPDISFVVFSPILPFPA